jgi:O-antigen ligase
VRCATAYPESVYVIDELYVWTNQILFWGLLGLRLWALVDCITRKVAAFPAVDKLTKPAWVAMLVFGALFGSVLVRDPVGPISLITAVLAAVYLADVRPAVREISDGSSR